MRATRISLFFFLLPGCTPATDLQGTTGDYLASGLGSMIRQDAGPAAGILLDPSIGAADIPLNLTHVLIGFREEVTLAQTTPALFLQSEDGTTLPLQFGQQIPCPNVCYAVRLEDRLLPERRFKVEIAAGGLQFLDGKPVPSGLVGEFLTGALSDDYAPRVDNLTIEAREGCLLFHITSDEAVRSLAEIESGETRLTFQPDGFAAASDFSWRDPKLPWGETALARVHLEDRAGNHTVSPDRSMLLPGPIPSLALVEFMPNPAGSESTQEWIEILNYGDKFVDLGGMYLVDKAGSDTLPAMLLAPGARALIVPEGYNSADPKDIPVRDGTMLVRVSGKLAGDGLSNAGESVMLLHPKGHIISQYGGYVNVSATAWSGKSVNRKAPEQCDNKAAWSMTPELPTPGW